MDVSAAVIMKLLNKSRARDGLGRDEVSEVRS